MLNLLFDEKKGPVYLMAFSVILLFATLGLRPLWNMENRWASIVMTMLTTGDYVHPYLGQREYYDKPLLSYWLIVPFAKLLGVNAWSLRLPNAIAGALSLLGVYSLANRFWGARSALWAGWILLTSLGFLFWARVAGADMLNVAGIVCAVWLYERHKEHPSFRAYLTFAVVLALTALCKGIVAIACTGMILLPDVSQQWKKHLNFKCLIALIFGGLLYFLPFYLSAHIHQGAYQENGLVEVFRENLLRFYQPFDHKGSWFIYFYYFPVYFFPWILFFIPAVYGIIKTWRTQPWSTRWMLLAVFLLLAFFMLSQSRRSYYILPLLPIAVLLVSAWIPRLSVAWLKRSAVFFLTISFLFYTVFIPLYYACDFRKIMDKQIKQIATAILPWNQWRMILWDAEMADVMYSLPEGRVWLYSANEIPAIQQALRECKPTIYVMSTSVYLAHRKEFPHTDIVLPFLAVSVIKDC